MKVIYIAGPFRGKNAWEVERNIRRAEELAVLGWQLGFAVICPHANTRFFDGAAHDSVFLDGDLEIMKRCDAVLMTRNWQSSVGATAERALALRRGIPVFESLLELDNWSKGIEPFD